MGWDHLSDGGQRLTVNSPNPPKSITPAAGQVPAFTSVVGHVFGKGRSSLHFTGSVVIPPPRLINKFLFRSEKSRHNKECLWLRSPFCLTSINYIVYSLRYFCIENLMQDSYGSKVSCYNSNYCFDRWLIKGCDESSFLYNKSRFYSSRVVCQQGNSWEYL